MTHFVVEKKKKECLGYNNRRAGEWGSSRDFVERTSFFELNAADELFNSLAKISGKS